MCINLKSKFIQTASEDLEVYKVVNNINGKLMSPVFYGKYEQEVEKTEKLKIIRDGFTKGEFRTTTGLYSFNIKNNPEECKKQLISFGGNLEVWIAIIPRGSKYVKEGPWLCSESLKLIHKVC